MSEEETEEEGAYYCECGAAMNADGTPIDFTDPCTCNVDEDKGGEE